MTESNETPNLEEGEYTMVMPFVSVKANGGPHDDASYVAGFECGAIDTALRVSNALGLVPDDRVMQTANQPQVDLMAMHAGYTVKFTMTDDQNWCVASFTRTPHEVVEQ